MATISELIEASIQSMDDWLGDNDNPDLDLLHHAHDLITKAYNAAQELREDCILRSRDRTATAAYNLGRVEGMIAWRL